MSFQLSRFNASISTGMYLKDPMSSELGRSIVSQSIELIDELGFEEFTFRKLAHCIGATEASIYRYFENKHMLLMYLSAWYWGWIEYRLVLKNANIVDARTRFRNAISLLAASDIETMQGIDLKKLFSIICYESSKAYLVKHVDLLNKHGFYFNYKKIVAIISNMIREINPDYCYPHMLVSTIIEGIHHQRFFASHLPSLTDKMPEPDYLATFYTDLAFASIQQSR
jgi:AcrR family transcriptional regulator